MLPPILEPLRRRFEVPSTKVPKRGGTRRGPWSALEGGAKRGAWSTRDGALEGGLA